MAKEIEEVAQIASGVRGDCGSPLHFTGQYLLDVLASVNTAVHTHTHTHIPAESGNIVLKPAVQYDICCVPVMTQHKARQVVIKDSPSAGRDFIPSLSLTLNLFPEVLWVILSFLSYIKHRTLLALNNHLLQPRTQWFPMTHKTAITSTRFQK